jgi:endonuclease G, mitochondrial
LKKSGSQLRAPWVLAVLALWPAFVLSPTVKAVEPVTSQAGMYGGLPRSQGFSPRTWTRVLENEGFSVGYSELRRNPLWVCYHAAPVKKRLSYRRPRDFKVDTRTWVRVQAGDYSHSRYQRGHLAPSWLMEQLHGRNAQLQTFLMSNITPQSPALNQKLWQRLEEIEADRFAQWFEGVWIIAGPIFDDDIQKLRSGVEIPDAFYRILLDEGQQRPQVLAFIVPQTVRGDEPLDQFLTTVDEIEARTGLDFLPDFDDEMEASLESTTADAAYWRLSEVSRLPGRY